MFFPKPENMTNRVKNLLKTLLLLVIALDFALERILRCQCYQFLDEKVKDLCGNKSTESIML